MIQENIGNSDEKLAAYLKEVEKNAFICLGVRVKLHAEKVVNTVDMNFITTLVANSLEIPFNKIVNSAKGDMEVSAARHIAMFLIRKYIPGVTLAEIGRFFKRDHTTIMYAIDHIEGVVFVRDAIADKVLKCENKLVQLIANNHESQLH